MVKAICNELRATTLYHYINCQSLVNKTADAISEQLRLVYQECVWRAPAPSLVLLDNLDLLLLDGASAGAHALDPSAQLQRAQVVEALKELLGFVWDGAASARVLTLAIVSSGVGEVAGMLGCVDEHGLFACFAHVRDHSVRV